MIDIQAITQQMQIQTPALNLRSSDSTTSEVASNDPFLAIIQSMVGQVEEMAQLDPNASLETIDLSLLMENLTEASGQNADLLSMLLGQNSDEEVDYEGLMELFAGLNATNTDILNLDTINLTNNSNAEQVVQIVSQTASQASEIVQSTGIDVSQLKGQPTPQTFDLNVKDTSQQMPTTENNTVFEMPVVTTTSESFESQMDLFNSFASKNLNIRNVADSGDTENEVFNILATSTETLELPVINETPITTIPKNPEIYTQISSAISQNAETLELGDNEFTMTLNPESLGEVTIKLINEAGKSTLQIVAASETATKLINDDLYALREAFRPLQIDVRNAEIAVVETQESQMQHFDMNNQNFDRNNQNFDQKSFVSYGDNSQTDEEAIEEVGQVSDPSNMSIYI